MKPNLTRTAGALFLIFTFLLSTFHTTPVRAINAPTPLAPANGAITTSTTTPPLGIPELKWAAIADATAYRLQISRDIAFATLLIDIVTTNTSYTPNISGGFTDGDWYWHVRVEAPAPVSAYNTPAWKFTKQWASPTNLPTLTSPANGATIDFYDSPTFSWTPVKGAARYKIQIYASSGGWATPLDGATTLTTSYQPPFKLPNGTSYYWRVVPLDIGEHQGTPSAESAFNASYNLVPTLLEPADGATPVFTPTFRWTAVRGAESYTLQYVSGNDFNAGAIQVITNSTSYTPTDTLSNDLNYYWRVKATSGQSVSDWTPARWFKKNWYIKPVLLTPTLGYLDQRFPVFSWTPVPGASKYVVELSLYPNFSQNFDVTETSNTYSTPVNYNHGLPVHFYWRVTPYDGGNRAGIASDNGEFDSYGTSVAPHQVYPPYYYTPDSYANFPGITTNPHEDRTVPLPIFIWHRVYTPAGDPNQGQVYADAYRVQVDDDPFFGSVNWTVDTQNTVAAPTNNNPFTPVNGTIYYWRVCPMIGGDCPLLVKNPTPGTPPTESWSQTWKTRFDLTKGLTPTSAGSVPNLIRPIGGFEYAEATPILEWFPISGATSYDVEISTTLDFSSTVDTATVHYPMYAPTQSFAQRSLGAVDFGVYYWRVRQTGSATWSTIRRFQIAAQSQWQSTRVSNSVANQLQIGSDTAGDTSNPDYDLTDLHATQSSDSWYFGFHVPASPSQNVTYALYLDLDHQNNSGGTTDPYIPAYNISTLSSYRPEYVVYILQEGGVFSYSKVRPYRWTSTTWEALGNMGTGTITQTGDYVELKIPNSFVGYNDKTGSYAISLVSLPAGGSGSPQDSVPSDPNVPGTGAISRFSNVTERMNLVMPPNNGGVDPSTFPSIQPFYWDWPVLSPWAGAIMKAYLDPGYSTEAANSSFVLTSITPYYARTSNPWGVDFQGDNTYYWRIQPRYLVNGNYILGAWSQGSRFERKGFVPQNLQTSVTFATPTFTWDMAEGAKYYDLWVDNDPNFNSLNIGISTAQNSFTSTFTLPNGIYYWKVRVNRLGIVTNDWSATQSFQLTLPTPNGLTPASETTVSRIPTLCWTPLIKNSTAGDPVLAAWKYRVQVSKDATFSNPFDGIDSEQSCWTSSNGANYQDGKFYWRVAMIDGNGKLGNYSPYSTFIKQYPISTLISPTSGSSSGGTPTFIWTPVNGAAKYKLEVSEFNTFSPLTDSVITDNTRFTPFFTYPLKKYYWRVAMMDFNDNIGPFNTATVILTLPTTTKTFTSFAAHDGYVLESTETSNVGGAINSTAATFNLGDDTKKKQYRSILSFSTGAGLPDAAVITSVSLKVKKNGYVGGNTNLLTDLQGIIVDIKNGFFGTSSALEAQDFQSAASKTYGPFTSPSILVSNYFTFGLTNGKDFINKTSANNGLTQMRLRFRLDDNNNAVANYLSLFSSNATNAADRPQLIIKYYVVTP